MDELSAAVPKSQTKRTYNHENNDAEMEKIHDFCYQKYYDLAMATQRQGGAQRQLRR
jgi:hypothetical protein